MKENKSYLLLKDHSVSEESFSLKQNERYGFLETYPQPDEAKLTSYYETEDYISHTDSKRNIFEKAYHLVRSISLKRKLKLINSYTSHEKNLLDIGCGTGDFLKTALNHGWSVSGIEPNEKARQIANHKTNQSVFDTEQLSKFKPNTFNVITLWHVLEHLPKLELHLDYFKTLLKKDGTLIIAVPNYNSFDAKHYKEFWAAYDVPRHLWHFNKKSISNLFALKQMKVVKTYPMLFDAFYVSLLSEKYKSGSMNIFKAFWIGLKSNLKAKQTKEYSSLIYIIKNSEN